MTNNNQHLSNSTERKNYQSLRVIELYSWVTFASLFSFRIIFYAAYGYENFGRIFLDYYSDFLTSIIIIMFPLLFKLVFGKLPFELIREKVNSPKENKKTVDDSIVIDDEKLSPVVENLYAPSNAESIIINLSLSSKKLADSLYSRAGVYLFVGVMIAFSGLVFFYSLTTASLKSVDLTSLLISLAPKFGILFFIEIIAFFFLKQYQKAMDEFRYYEAIKRRREEMVFLITVCEEKSCSIDFMELIKMDKFFSVAGRLEKEQTTEILEARKLEKNELAVLEKIIEVIAPKNK